MSVDPVLSRDGARVASLVPYGASSQGDGDVQNEVWLKSLVDGSEFPVFADDYSRSCPLWSPDGMQLIYDRKDLRTREHQLMLWSQ